MITNSTWLSELQIYVLMFGPGLLTGLALLLLVLDRKSDTKTKTLWVLIIALIPVIGPLVCLFVRPRLKPVEKNTN